MNGLQESIIHDPIICARRIEELEKSLAETIGRLKKAENRAKKAENRAKKAENRAKKFRSKIGKI